MGDAMGASPSSPSLELTHLVAVSYRARLQYWLDSTGVDVSVVVAMCVVVGGCVWLWVAVCGCGCVWLCVCSCVSDYNHQ